MGGRHNTDDSLFGLFLDLLHKVSPDIPGTAKSSVGIEIFNH